MRRRGGLFSVYSAPPREMFVGIVHGKVLQLAGEGLVQQRLFQRLQRGELPLVEAREALGYRCEDTRC